MPKLRKLTHDRPGSVTFSFFCRSRVKLITSLHAIFSPNAEPNIEVLPINDNAVCIYLIGNRGSNYFAIVIRQCTKIYKLPCHALVMCVCLGIDRKDKLIN